jgi:hypothetical protein
MGIDAQHHLRLAFEKKMQLVLTRGRIIASKFPSRALISLAEYLFCSGANGRKMEKTGRFIHAVRGIPFHDCVSLQDITF